MALEENIWSRIFGIHSSFSIHRICGLTLKTDFCAGARAGAGDGGGKSKSGQTVEKLSSSWVSPLLTCWTTWMIKHVVSWADREAFFFDGRKAVQFCDELEKKTSWCLEKAARSLSKKTLSVDRTC